jgi:DNA-binding transcriptional MerR regulator
LSGLGIDTLRAWERRHKAVAPRRGDRGRIYTEADVRRLRLLRDAVRRGHPIGRIARLDDRQLSRLGASDDALTAAGKADPERQEPLVVDIDAALAAAARLDAAALDAALGRAAGLLTPRHFLTDVLPPLLAAGPLARAAARNLLGAMLRLRAPATVPGRLLFAAAAAEELDLLKAALVAAAGGLDVIYLGACFTIDDLLDATTLSEADVVVLAVDQSDLALAAASALPRDVELWLVGRGAGRAAEGVGARAVDVHDPGVLDAQLTRIGGRL